MIDHDFARALAAHRRHAPPDRRRRLKAGRVVHPRLEDVLPLTAVQAVRLLEGYCEEFLYTHVDKEGLMQGTDMAAIKAVAKATERKLTAAGGITTRAEIDALDALGIDAVVGMAIYTGLARARLSHWIIGRRIGLHRRSRDAQPRERSGTQNATNQRHQTIRPTPIATIRPSAAAARATIPQHVDERPGCCRPAPRRSRPARSAASTPAAARSAATGRPGRHPAERSSPACSAAANMLALLEHLNSSIVVCSCAITLNQADHNARRLRRGCVHGCHDSRLQAL